MDSMLPVWFCLFGVIGFVIQLVLAIWVYGDANNRGENGTLWLIVFLVGGIIGLIIWLIVRPPIQTYNPYDDYAENWSGILENNKGRKKYHPNNIKGTYRCPMCGNESFHVEYDDSAHCRSCGYATMNFKSNRYE